MMDNAGVLLVLTGVRCYVAQDSVGDMLTYLRYVLCWISYEARRPLPASVHPRPASRDSGTRPAPDGSAARLPDRARVYGSNLRHQGAPTWPGRADARRPPRPLRRRAGMGL